MHRSGTSAMTGVLERLGIPLPGEILPAETYNEKGIFENKAVNLFHNRLLAHLGARWDDPMPVSNAFVETPAGEGFVSELTDIVGTELLSENRMFAVKDPRMCRFVPLWRAALARLAVDPRAIIPLRHPLDVASSLRTRDKFVRAKSFLLWLEHTLAAEAETRDLPRCFVAYDGLLQDWRGTADRLAAELALTWPKERGRVEADIDAFLSQDLRHHKDRAAIGEGTRLDVMIAAAWDALLRLVDDEADEGARTALDAIRAELAGATAVLSPYVAWEFHALAEALTTVDRLTFEQTALRNELEFHTTAWRNEKAATEAHHRALLSDEQRQRRASERRERDLRAERESLIAATSELDGLRHEAGRLRHEAGTLRYEIDVRSHALEAMRSSTSWRLLGPVRSIGAYLPPSAKTALRRTLKAGWWVATPWRMPARRRVMEARAREAWLAISAPGRQEPAGAVAGVQARRPASAGGARRSIGQPPLHIFPAVSDRPRLSMVTDSINAGSLFGGVATALIFTALLAERSGRKFRVVTRTQAPDADNVAALFRAQGIAWTGNIEFAFADINDDASEIDVAEDEIFVTTSWWTTHSTRQSVADDRIIYILQEDERMFYPFGDESLLCAETLSDPKIRKVINSDLLRRHLVDDGIISDETPFFEPAFPSRIYFPQQSADGKRKFFFYARPNNPRNLYERGVAAIEEAIRQGILDPEQWDIYFVGKDLKPMEIAGSVRPILLQNLAWEDYADFVRSVDLALTLMYTPHPSYPPLDVAACGGVAVTNRFGVKTDLSVYSPSLICVDADVDSLVAGLKRGASLALEQSARGPHAADNKILRDWNVAFAPVFQSLAKDGILVP